jgi:hypothetical protein
MMRGKDRVRIPGLVLCALSAAWSSACGSSDGGNPAGSSDAGNDAESAAPGTPATHDEVAALLGVGPDHASSCSVSSCHGDAAEANLNLKSGSDLRAMFVSVPACEAPGFNLVEPGKPEKSWLWIKLTGKISSEITGDLVPQKDWGTAGTDCPGAGGFGKRMPRVSPYSLKPEELERVRSWIEAGAPGPEV